MINQQSITEFLDSIPRHKLVVVKDIMSFADIPTLNVGKEIASYIQLNNLIQSKDLNILVVEQLYNLIRERTTLYSSFGRTICLTNLGIVFEKKLGIDIEAILKDISRNTLVIIEWEGLLVENKLYFLNTASPDYIDLKGINYIA